MENLNGECECRKRKSYLNVFDSDEESSSDKSKKIRSGDIKPPSEDNCSGYVVESERETDGFEAFDCGPKTAGSQSSIGIGEEAAAQSEYENSADYIPNQSDKSEYQTSNWKAATASPNPWIAKCAHGTATLKWPVYTANQPSIRKPDLYWGHDADAHPLIRAAWAGAFTVYCDLEDTCAIFDGLKGCVSSKACAPARSVVERLPSTIVWEKLPRRSVWPKSFERMGGPTADDIAVFFFPSVTKHESTYESLLFDLIRHDTALKTSVMGSELLLFTSVELPPLFTRFQDKLYLWGVFRGNQPPL